MAERAPAGRMDMGGCLGAMQGLGQGATHGQAEGQDDGSQAEGNAPAITLHVVRAHQVGHEQSDKGAGEGGDGLAGALP